MSTLKIRPLSSALQKIAIEELNEVPNRMQSDIENLREWIKKQPHLKARTSDQFLLTFLRGSKYSLEKAKNKIDMYYTLRGSMPEIFSNRDVDDPKIIAIHRLGIGLECLKTDNETAPCITIIHPGVYDPNEYTFTESVKVGGMIGDITLMENDNAIICGHIEILDLANVTAGHFIQLQPTLLKKLTMIGQEATPTRHKGLHVINAPQGADTIFNMLKSFMSEKNQQRLFVHTKNLESLYEHVPQKLLPTEYGGEAGSIQEIIDYWENKLINYRDYFNEDKLYGTDEKLRKGPSLFDESLFGVDGSFRQLNVD